MQLSKWPESAHGTTTAVEKTSSATAHGVKKTGQGIEKGVKGVGHMRQRLADALRLKPVKVTVDDCYFILEGCDRMKRYVFFESH